MYIFFINHPELSTCTDIKEKEDSEKLKEEEDMNRGWILLGILCLSYIPSIVRAGKAACHDPFYRRCYGIPHTCPAGCPKLCEIDCRLCKPYCSCDRPGAVCQDPRLIGEWQEGTRFHLVQSIGVLFGSHQLYIGAKKVSKWHESVDNMLIQLNGEEIMVPAGMSKDGGCSGRAGGNRSTCGSNFFRGIKVHGYDITEDDCFAHLELNFKFHTLSKRVDGVLGQTYRSSYRSRVKLAAAMPIMGGADKFNTSHLFATDCAVSNFGLKKGIAEGGEPLTT
ncbi:hypothetical protein CK203_005614 [Vitis vinifera]|uniref:Uncharacterized protein n=1 Tax=Vitis vinifera TaxID=29760 RepID=A0A438K3R0_VITVI|nr:hypothetical protein CK203_005614 [Vitis vinifera]